jgi:phage gpG-like protein
MADKLEVRVVASHKVIEALQKRLTDASPSSGPVKHALMRMGAILVAQIKMNIRRKRIIDQGRLLNSIRFQFVRPEEGSTELGLRMLIGSFGVPYAAMHEFGGTYRQQQMRAMFASLKNRGKLNKSGGGKGIMQGRYLRARPYIRPAWERHKDRVTELIKESIEAGV